MVTNDDVQYHIEIEGDGFPVVLLHGFTGDNTTWDGLRPYLNDYRIIAVDLLGHGKTDCPEDQNRYRIEQAVSDLKFLLDSLNIHEAYILGYSMGGRLALAFTAAYPSMVKALILESSSPGLKTKEERKQRAESDKSSLK